MTVRVQEFLDNEKLPAFLKKNKTLLSIDKISKVFPKFGLPNCKEDIVLDNAPFVMASALTFIRTFGYIIEPPVRELNSYRKYYEEYITDGRVSPETLDKIAAYGTIVRNLYIELSAHPQERMITNTNGKLSVKLANNVFDKFGTTVFKSGESLFKVYNKVYKTLAELKCGIRIEKLDTMPEFKRFSSDNLPHDRFQIVFSSDGLDGLWDIATMSMRGVSSCQSWNGQYKTNLVGSLVDPFVGLIYITSGTNMNDLGTKMVKRSIVRYVVISRNKKPCFVIDKIYPDHDDEIQNKFVDFIKTKTGNKFDVFFGPLIPDMLEKGAYIPANPIHKKLTSTTNSYRDTKIPFKADAPIELSVFDKNIGTRKSKFRNILRNTSFDAASHHVVNVKYNNSGVQSTIDTIIGSNDFKFLVRDYYRDVADKIIKSCPTSDILSSKEYMRRLCHYYINNRDDVTRGIKISFAKKINSYWDGQVPSKVSSKHLSKILNQIQHHIDTDIKKELKSLLVKKYAALKLPN